MLSVAFCAAQNGDLVALQQHVAAGWDAHTLDKHGSTALMWAAGGGHLDVCKYLVNTCGLSAAGGIDGVGGNGVSKKQRKRLRSPLHWAARHGRLSVCKCVMLHSVNNGLMGVGRPHTLLPHKRSPLRGLWSFTRP